MSIVTHKVQTTRAIIRGIATHKQAQIVLLDMPGIFKPRRALDRAMVSTAWGGAKDADIVLVLIDAERGIKGDADMILDSLSEVRQPKILVLNKVDQVRPESLLKLTTEVNARADFDAHVHGVGADRLWLRRTCSTIWPRRCPPGPGTIPRTRSPTCRCASWPPKSPAKSSICGCIRSCPIPRMSKPRSGKRRRTARSGSSR